MTEIESIKDYAEKIIDYWCEQIVETACDEFSMAVPAEEPIKQAIAVTDFDALMWDFIDLDLTELEEYYEEFPEEDVPAIVAEEVTGWFGDDPHDFVPYLMKYAKEFLDERNNHEN